MKELIEKYKKSISNHEAVINVYEGDIDLMFYEKRLLEQSKIIINANKKFIQDLEELEKKEQGKVKTFYIVPMDWDRIEKEEKKKPTLFCFECCRSEKKETCILVGYKCLIDDEYVNVKKATDCKYYKDKRDID